MYVCVWGAYTHVYTPATEHKWGSEDNSGELVFYFNHVGSRDQTQITGLGGKPPYPLSHLSPTFLFLFLLFPVVNLIMLYETLSTFNAFPDDQPITKCFICANEYI